MYYERLQLLAQREKRAFSVVPPIITPDTLKSGDDNYDPNDTSRLTANPYNTFENKQTYQEAFKTAKPSVPYMVTGVDASGNKYIDGAQTHKNIYGGNADFQRRAEEQMARARWEQARAGGLTNAESGPSLNHPVVLNPGGKGRSLWNRFKYDSDYQLPPDASGSPNKQTPIKQETVGNNRGFYSPSKDYIGLADPSQAPQPGVKFPQPIGSLPHPTLRYFDKNRYSPAFNKYRGVANNRTDPTANYTEQNILQEEGTHSQTPTSFIPGMDKNNDPNVFTPKDKMPREYHDSVMEKRRPYTPIVPGMQGSYDQWPPEFVKSRKLDQNDAQATYGHRIQNGKELLDYHNMLKVYGTPEEWRQSQPNLTKQHAEALGRLRSQSEQQRLQEWNRLNEEYNQGKSQTAPVPVDQMPLKPVQATYDFTDQTDLMKQVRNNRQPGRMDKIAFTLNSSYNRLMNEGRMTKIAATLQKTTDGLKLSDRPAGKRVQPPRAMSTPASAELIRQKRENEGDCQAKQAYTVDYIAFPADGTKQAYDLSGRMEAQAIMDRIYNEDPSYWPYGLGIPGHDGVYLIRDKMTKQAAGFVGWQQMMEGGRLIGSYSIGILPEYRGHGFAKEAVAKILREKAAGVDEVRSYVMPHNQKLSCVREGYVRCEYMGQKVIEYPR